MIKEDNIIELRNALMIYNYKLATLSLCEKLDENNKPSIGFCITRGDTYGTTVNNIEAYYSIPKDSILKISYENLPKESERLYEKIVGDDKTIPTHPSEKIEKSRLVLCKLVRAECGVEKTHYFYFTNFENSVKFIRYIGTVIGWFEEEKEK